MTGLDTTDAISFAFGLFNLLRLASYFPQMVAVARDDRGPHAISLTCWTVWGERDDRSLRMGATRRRRARIGQCVQHGLLCARLLHRWIQARRLHPVPDDSKAGGCMRRLSPWLAAVRN